MVTATQPKPPTPDEPDGAATRLVRMSFLNFVGLGAGSVLQFVMVVVLSRGLHASEVGILFECIAITKILTIIGTLGLDFTAARSISLARSKHDALQIGRFEVGLAVWLAVGASLAVIGLTAVLASPLAMSLSMPHLGRPLILMSPVVLFAATEAVLIAATRGFGRARPYVLVDQLLDGGVRLAAVGAGIAVGLSTGAIAAIYAGSAAVTLAGAVWCARDLVNLRVRLPMKRVRSLLAFTGFQWGAEIATVGLLWLDTILLSIWRPASDVGIYSVATRTILLGTVFTTPVLLAFQPQIGRALAARDDAAVTRLYSFATKLALIVGGPPFIFVAVFGPILLRVTYGHSYSSGAWALAALAAGQVVNAATGPCGYLVTMAGRSDQMLITMAGAVAGNVALNSVLIPKYGMTGAGVAWGVSLAGANLARLYYARRTLGGRLPSRLWDPRSAGYVAAFAALCVVSRSITASFSDAAALGVSVILCGAAYLGLLAHENVLRTLGIDPRAKKHGEAHLEGA